MSGDPRAVVPALTRLVEDLAKELRARRDPLETALCDLLSAANLNFGPEELAVQLDAVGGAVRGAGLGDEVARLYQSRAGSADPITGSGGTAALALLDAAVREQRDRVADLLARLHRDHADRLPDVRHRLDRVAEHLLVVWCDRHAADLPGRFDAELLRLGLTRHLVERWFDDHNPRLSDAGERLLIALLDAPHAGQPFAVGWLADPIDPALDDEGRLDEDAAGPGADVVTAPAPASRSKPRRGIPRDQAEELVAGWLRKNAPADPQAVTVRQISKATGVSTGQICKFRSWQAFQKERNRQRPLSPRAVPLTSAMRAVIPDGVAENPADVAMRNEASESATAETDGEVLRELLLYADTTDERVKMENMGQFERRALLAEIRKQHREQAQEDAALARRKRSRRS